MAKDINSIFFDITSEIEELALKCEKNNGCMCIKDRGWYIRSMRRKPVL